MRFSYFYTLLFFSCSLILSVTNAQAEETVLQNDFSGNKQASVARENKRNDTIQQDHGFPIIRKLPNDRLQLGNIIINKKSRQVLVKGVINMDEGLVEYLACGSNGKLHESILMTDVNPYYLQIALLLIGIEPGNSPITEQGARETPVGDPVDLWVAWTGKDKKMKKYRAEQLILNKKRNAPMQKTHWTFTGSVFYQDRFLAAVEQSIVAIYHDPVALIDHPLGTGADDKIFFVNTALVPEKGTPVTFVIQKVKERKRSNRSGRNRHRPESTIKKLKSQEN